ncbi:CLIP domain-containing serine protease 14D-like [Amphibalanus amphitrite]|uniref:CLIP domain-containing serine protease 14D-like n=1 Tax=Amphibalanus amphitrite TaxID=1232801 RepID=UPI001C91C1F7|nr:CLIP domain-containing serine protease 14D-like [Amphibalanus amphitrite]XP_043217206.1 CLIP domain-containing serine protease 14D-like [Amphibalanus amphitrite]
MHRPLPLSVLVAAVCLLTAVSGAGRHRRQLGRPGSACSDPFGRAGVCGTLHQCPALLQVVSGTGVSSPQTVHILRQFVCGRVQRTPLFCCPSRAGAGQQARPSGGGGAGQHQGSPEQHPNRAIVERGFSCGTYFSDRVVGGKQVPVGKFPWVAVLGYSDRGAPVKFECGGTLISLQHVLTAAHCVADLPAGLRLTTVRLGEYDFSSPLDCLRSGGGPRNCSAPQDFRVARTFVHESYNRPNERDNDIALLKLDRPVSETLFVGKICLPFGEARQRNYDGVGMTVAGFGRTGPRRFGPNSLVMNEVRLPGVPLQECSAILRSKGAVITSKHICAGGQPGQDSCAGDSGGPLMAATRTGPPYSLVGVVSFGAVRCGEGGVPSVNTRVSEYLNWILDRVDR